MSMPTQLLSRLFKGAPVPPPALDACPPPAADIAIDTAPGCGWFDSSHELHCGLCVTEHATPDTVAAELPLDAWVDLHLAGWSPSRASIQ